MRNILMAAAGRNDWRKHVKIDLDIRASTVVNKVNGLAATLPSGITFTDTPEGKVVVFTSAVFGGLSFPHAAEYAPGTGDFTMESIIDVDGVHLQTVGNSEIVPIASWGTWAAPGNTLNMDFFYNHLNGGALRLGNYNVNGVSNFVGKDGIGLIDQTKYIHTVVQRRKGIIYFYQNGVLVDTVPYAINLNAAISGPFRIMSRRGGGDGSVWWRFQGKLRGFRFTHAAIYNGASFTPVVKF